MVVVKDAVFIPGFINFMPLMIEEVERCTWVQQVQCL